MNKSTLIVLLLLFCQLIISLGIVVFRARGFELAPN